ncbi:MAG: lysine 2,3-aminomutase, partial [Geobacteraceae bacterium]|nr:lysine 2,3-aminomutase [Geobacteraceae bacterium]
MEEWQQENKNACNTAAQLLAHGLEDGAMLERVAEQYPLRLTPHLLNLIQTHAAPIARQFVPAALELDADGEVDPLNEEGLSPVPHVVHRY